ncbi:hypothetical protein CNYM01_00913 [Colletotrichum nymphaeae SA-01]|uniref:Uncharacterized protein n=1 Tax=Colletotrichum nymphaeae SA-01 TaxID=1460502 RepID=A0A135UY52_9PEZI|nr:hypothetical protein CNYM01_00913 [Colletotrichum nymphaeae SA-01]
MLLLTEIPRGQSPGGWVDKTDKNLVKPTRDREPVLVKPSSISRQERPENAVTTVTSILATGFVSSMIGVGVSDWEIREASRIWIIRLALVLSFSLPSAMPAASFAWRTLTRLRFPFTVHLGPTGLGLLSSASTFSLRPGAALIDGGPDFLECDRTPKASRGGLGRASPSEASEG